jgi:hypothetical protein
MLGFKEFRELLSQMGLDFTTLLEILTGKAENKKIAQILTPLLSKFSPFVGKAITFLESQHCQKGGRIVLIIDNAMDDTNNPVEMLSACHIMPDGSMEIKESIPLAQLANYVIRIVERQKQLELQQAQWQLSEASLLHSSPEMVGNDQTTSVTEVV